MPQPKNRREFVCEHCGQPFTAKACRGHVPYCGMACYNAARAVAVITVACAQCGKPIRTYRNHMAKYCSASCAMTARNLTEANPCYSRDISGERNPMYGRRGMCGERNPMYGHTREKSSNWRGGRKVRADGYILIAAPDGYPHPIGGRNGTGGYVLEHRLVMEQHLGRYLLPTEVVHHIDGNPGNNDIANLRLFDTQSMHIREGHPTKR